MAGPKKTSGPLRTNVRNRCQVQGAKNHIANRLIYVTNKDKRKPRKKHSFCIKDRFHLLIQYTKLGIPLNMNPKEGEMKLTCTLCGRKLKNSFTLKRHFDKIHNKTCETRYECMLCPKSYSRIEGWKEHALKAHSDAQEISYIIRKTNTAAQQVHNYYIPQLTITQVTFTPVLPSAITTNNSLLELPSTN